MRAEMAKGAAWMVLFRLVDRSVGIVSTAVLARLLLPADFGLVAMAMSVIAIIELATAFSFEIALIQKKDPQREHFDTAWTLNVIVAGVGALLTAGLAYPAAAFYGDPRLTPVMFAIGAAWFVSGFENVGTVNFRRNMDFASEFRLMATKRLIAFAVTMVAAWIFRSYWTLVVGMATGRIAGVVLSYGMQPFRPRLRLSHSRELFSFSGWMLISNFATVLLGRVPHFVVGRAFGAHELGAYTVGAEIANLPHTELVAPINRAMFPGYSRLVGDLEAFRRTCIEATAALFLLVLPLSVGVAILADAVVRILLGAQWPQAAPIIQILAFAGAVSALTSNNMSAYLALGRPHLCSVTLLVRAGILAVALVFVSTRYGVLGVAFAELAAAMGSLAVSVPILSSTLALPAHRYFASLWRPLLGSAMMGTCLYYLLPPPTVDAGVAAAIERLVVGALAGAVLYPLFIAVLWLLSGRPESVETMVARRLRDEVTVRVRRFV